MESIIVYIIIAGVVVVNILRNYNKEKKKNQNRNIFPSPSPIRPFSKPSAQPTIFAPINKPQAFSGNLSEPQTDDFELQESAPMNNINNKVNYSQEGGSILAHLERTQSDRFQGVIKEDENIAISNLELSTADDCKKAFIHSIIFERKY